MGATRGKRYINLTEKEWERIKQLTDIDTLSYKKIGEIVGRGNSTVGYIARSQSFEDYKQIIREMNDRSHQQKAEENLKEKQEEVEVHTETPVDEPDESPQTDPVLERIASALERLADAWERSPEVENDTPVVPERKRIFRL